MMNDDEELKEGLMKSMSEPAKPKKDDDAYGKFVRKKMADLSGTEPFDPYKDHNKKFDRNREP